MADTSLAGDRVVLVDRTDSADGPAAHGREALLDALAAAGTTTETVGYWTAADRDASLVAGTTDDPVIRRLLDDAPTAPESTVYRRRDTGDGTVLVAAGTDERGLAYALLELAERVEADGAGALDAVEDGVETPDNRVRGVDRFVEGPIEDDWFYDDDFWEYYLDRLVRCRFNRFVLVTGYDTAFMSPPYPFFVDVPAFPDVGLSDEVAASRETHREQLRRIGELCHERGLDFFFGIWQQQPWTDYQGVLVENLPEGGDYARYCAAGMERLLTECPAVDGVQLRVNHESGVTAEDGHATAEAFWNSIVDAVAEASAARAAPVSLDLRAKGLTDAMIDHALETGLDVTVPTKFWCESTGLPYHNSRMRRGELDNLDDPNRSRRYSYADMLEKPRFYDVLYRLWVIGTNRIFVWGDPDYARRFSEAAQFGGATGFEVTAPLSLKGGHFGIQEAWPLFDDPDLRDYEYEDERYWAWYRLFGRLGYSTETDAAVWEREFDARFGPAADAIEEGYRAASKVLPLVTAAHLTSHPALHNWAELDTGGALFAEHNANDVFGDTTYATAEPSDPGLFYAVEEYVHDELAGDIAGKYTPPQVARWLDHLAEETVAAVAEAEARATDAPDTGEYLATLLDLRMLADLAAFHAHKTHAALGLSRYREADDVDALADALASMRAAREAWAALAERGQDTYHDDLRFGTGPPAGDEGQWIDRLEEVDADVDELERLADIEGVDTGGTTDASIPDAGFGPFPAASFDLDLPGRWSAGEDLPVAVAAGELNGADAVRLHYRHTNQLEGAFESVEMEPVDGGYRATVPGEYLTPEWDLLAYVSAVDAAGDVTVVPGLYHATEAMPYRVVEVDGDGDA